ncbi:MAG: hypothetical protein L6V93_19370 [Clostridiales bacterium]|nr:MAG: hypothetical protein L6V93_19370 [Clostridiales bacterium]
MKYALTIAAAAVSAAVILGIIKKKIFPKKNIQGVTRYGFSDKKISTTKW